MHWTVPQGRFLYFNFSLIFFSFVNGHRCNKDAFATRPSDWTSFRMTSLFWLPRSSAIFKRATSSCGIFYWIFFVNPFLFWFYCCYVRQGVILLFFYRYVFWLHYLYTKETIYIFCCYFFFLLFVIGQLP